MKLRFGKFGNCLLLSNFNLQAIIGEEYVFGEEACGFCVCSHVVAEMNKKCAARSNFSYYLQGGIKVKVGMVWLYAECIEDEGVNAGNLAECFLRNGFGIRNVCKFVAYFIACYG